MSAEPQLVKSSELPEIGELVGELSAIPEDFKELERMYIRRTEEAIASGLELERWARDPERRIEETMLPPYPNATLPNKQWCYFPSITIQGKTLTAIGGRQEVEFGKIIGPNPEEQLREYVFRDFLNDATWLYPNGEYGGFRIEQLVYCRANGSHGRYRLDQKTKIRDWRKLGRVYKWSLFTILLNDFAFRMGKTKVPFIPPEAVTVVQTPEFMHVVENPKPGFKLEVAIGFPFIDHAPIPNFFGFGPGKFAWAIQTFSFLLREDNTVRCDLDFIAGPRPKRVFAFGKLPCPVYGTADLLGKLTFGLFPARKVHDHMDTEMSLRHCRVHHALMEGTAKIFAAGARQRAAKQVQAKRKAAAAAKAGS